MPPCNSSIPQIAIIILNWNGKKDTLACLESLQHVHYPHFLPIVVDNHSSDDSVSAIRCQYPHVTLIENKTNLGFAEGNNVGIRFALTTSAAFILLLNNDTLVAPNFLNAFIDHFDQHSETAILGAKIYRQSAPDTLDHWGGCWNPHTARFDLIGLNEQEPLSPPIHLDYICGAALMARRIVWETIGLLEPKFFLIWEEADWCRRATQQGFSLHICPNAHLWHKVSASFTGKAHSTYFWWRNRLLWIHRNQSPAEKRRLYWKVLIPEIAHLLKIYLLKHSQLAIRKRLLPHRSFAEQEAKLFNNKAALQGILDYARSRFGNAPSWIYTGRK